MSKFEFIMMFVPVVHYAAMAFNLAYLLLVASFLPLSGLSAY